MLDLLTRVWPGRCCWEVVLLRRLPRLRSFSASLHEGYLLLDFGGMIGRFWLPWYVSRRASPCPYPSRLLTQVSVCAMGHGHLEMDTDFAILLWASYDLCWERTAHKISEGQASVTSNLLACSRILQTFVGIQTLYFLNAVLTKVSLLLLYYRIFGVVKKFRIAIYVSLFIVVAYWIPCTIIAFLGCTPFERNWNKTIPGSCVDLVTFFRWNGICNLLIDFLILLLPLPMVWTLNIPVRQRLELTGIFALGLLYANSSFFHTETNALTASALPQSCVFSRTNQLNSTTLHTQALTR